MTDKKKTTHDLLVESLTVPYKKAVRNTQPTTHQITQERYTEQYRKEPIDHRA